jgi:hypothetical protein
MGPVCAQAAHLARHFLQRRPGSIQPPCTAASAMGVIDSDVSFLVRVGANVLQSGPVSVVCREGSLLRVVGTEGRNHVHVPPFLQRPERGDLETLASLSCL